MTRPRTPPPVYGSGILEEKRRQTDYKKPAIIGPTHLVYPRNEGWRPKGQKGKTENGRPRKLSDITIHGITDHLTKRITRKTKPNCIRNWKKRVRFRIDFKKVFSSFGTPLSNDAEERQWRKYVHRAINVRNRNPALTEHKCRLCNREEESMLHLVKCRHTRPLWNKCLRFCHEILGAPTDQSPA